MTIGPINLRAWPGRGAAGKTRAPRRPTAPQRLHRYGALVLVLVAERGAVPERIGLGVALSVLGPTVVRTCLMVADDLEPRDPDTFATLGSWAQGVSYPTPRGLGHPEVLTRRSFCDPDDGLLLRSYTGGSFLLTADEGRSLGLLAEHTAPARRHFKGGFSMGLPGWGEMATWTDGAGRECRGWRALAHRPVLRAKALGGHGLMAEWGRAARGGKLPGGGQAGHWEKGRPFLGRIVDLVGPAFALDGIDTSDLAEHLAAFGLPALSVPAALPVGPEGAEVLLAVARAIHALALALDEEAARWW
ncbi:MAG: hypothetical protein ACRDZQ_15965 [Acidimicrobiales bacterium]